MFTLKFNRPAFGDVERPKVCQIHMGKSKENLRSKDKKKKEFNQINRFIEKEK